MIRLIRIPYKHTSRPEGNGVRLCRSVRAKIKDPDKEPWPSFRRQFSDPPRRALQQTGLRAHNSIQVSPYYYSSTLSLLFLRSYCTYPTYVFKPNLSSHLNPFLPLPPSPNPFLQPPPEQIQHLIPLPIPTTPTTPLHPHPRPQNGRLLLHLHLQRHKPPPHRHHRPHPPRRRRRRRLHVRRRRRRDQIRHGKVLQSRSESRGEDAREERRDAGRGVLVSLF